MRSPLPDLSQWGPRPAISTEESHIPRWTLGDRLRKARLHAGLDQGELAEAIGISRNTVVNYEGDKTPPRKIVINSWSSVTDVPLEWILEGVVPGLGHATVA